MARGINAKVTRPRKRRAQDRVGQSIPVPLHVLVRSRRNPMLRVVKSLTINRPRQEVYEYWRDLRHLPTFMIHLEAVTPSGDTRSHWVAKAPGGRVEWDAEIIEDRADEIIAWRSLEGSEVPNGGSVRFRDAPADRGTEVHVDLHYDPPAGSAGAMVASCSGGTGQQLRDDSSPVQQVMEPEKWCARWQPRGRRPGRRHTASGQAPEVEVRS